MSRNTWILLGAGLAAFFAFVLLGGGEDSSWTGGGTGLIRLFRGGGERTTGGMAGKSTSPGAMAPAGSDGTRRGTAAAGAANRARKTHGRSGGPPDPELLRRMQVGGGGLVPKGPALAPRAGIIQQFFRTGGKAAPGDDGTTVGGGAGAGEDNGGDPGTQDPNQCGAPVVQKMVVDLKQRPEMILAFEVPSRSSAISNGMGEIFRIGDAPAFVILIPRTKNASAGAIFDGRFLVLIKGRCIPDRQYVKSLLRQ